MNILSRINQMDKAHSTKNISSIRVNFRFSNRVNLLNFQIHRTKESKDIFPLENKTNLL